MKNQHGIDPAASGFSLIEMMIGAAMVGLIAIGSGFLFTSASKNLSRIRLRNQLQSESQSCMDTIARLLHNASPNTVLINTVSIPGATAPPNDSISFNAPDGTAYHFFWAGTPGNLSALPTNYVLMQMIPPGLAPHARVILATHVTSIMFTGDSRNLNSVIVSLRLDAALDSSGRADRIVTYEIPNRTIVLTGNLKAT